jgi:hypothetical protein
MRCVVVITVISAWCYLRLRLRLLAATAYGPLVAYRLAAGGWWL